MKIVNIIGGLGNQMFQYALFLALKKHFPDELIKICTKGFNGYAKHNAYELDRVFGIDEQLATTTDLLKVAYPFTGYRSWQIQNHLLPARRTMKRDIVYGHFYEDVLTSTEYRFYDGYWHNERYFNDIREELTKAFKPIHIDKKNEYFANEVSSINSVSIHVRRGDFLESAKYKGLADLTYYEKAIRHIQQSTHVDKFVIFSNDIQWTKENILSLLGDTPFTIIDWNKGENSYLDMYLMSQCKNNIIANSTFSWWAAWLNTHEDSIITAPDKWVNMARNEFTLPQRWIKI